MALLRRPLSHRMLLGLTIAPLVLGSESKSVFASEARSGQVARDARIEHTDAWYSDLVSPFTQAPIQMLVGTVATSSLLVNSRAFSHSTQRSLTSRHSGRSISSIGNIAGQLLPNGLYALGAWSFGGEGGSHLANTMVKATLYSAAVTTALKYSIREQRPDSSQRNSFPSGHSTTAFAFASVVAMNHPLAYGVGAYALASLCGFTRINDNRHYLHDVLAGATIGISYGIGISKNDSARAELRPGKVEITAYPILSPDSAGISLNFRR